MAENINTKKNLHNSHRKTTSNTEGTRISITTAFSEETMEVRKK